MVRATGCPAPQRKLEGRRVSPDPEDEDGPQGTEYAVASPLPFTKGLPPTKGQQAEKGGAMPWVRMNLRNGNGLI